MLMKMHTICFKLIFIFSVFNFMSANAQNNPGILIVRPKEITEVLVNPGIGFTTFQRFNGDTLTYRNDKNGWTEGDTIVFQPFHGSTTNEAYPQTSIAYWRVYWKFLEPEKGKYRWDLIDKALLTAQERGQTLMLRVAPYGGENNDVPLWYRKMTGKNTNWKYNNPVNKWLVDAEDPRYVQYFGGFIKQLAKKYDGHPALESVDISIVGAWGEGGGSAMLSDKVRKGLVDSYTKHFIKTPLIALLTDEKTNKYIISTANAGWRVDCIGDLGFWAKDQNGWTHMYDYYPQSIIKFGVKDSWTKAPVSLEICGTLYSWMNQQKYDTVDLKYIIDQTLKWHISSFNAKSSPMPAEWEHIINYWLTHMGYRFVLRKFSCNKVVKRSNKLFFETWWENKGDAPCYKDYSLAIKLQKEKDSIIFYTNANIRKWLPGDNLYDSFIFIPENLHAGIYNIKIALVNPVTKKPSIQLAIEGKDSEGWYNLDKIEIK
jgi:hypothetical protein